MAERVRLGIVGAGHVGHAYADALVDHPDAMLAGVADSARGIAASIGDPAGAPSYDSTEALLADGACDAVVLCTPPACHGADASAALDAGVAVLCEKPFATSVVSALRVLDRAERLAIPVTLATKFRFADGVRRAHDLVASGALGEVERIQVTFVAPVATESTWRADPVQAGGGVIADNGPHALDLCRRFAGPVLEVLAVAGRPVSSGAVEDSADILARTAVSLCSIELSWRYPATTDIYLAVQGTNGVVRVGWGGAQHRGGASTAWEQIGSAYDKRACFRAQLADFCAGVRGDGRFALDRADVFATVETVAACYDSLARRGWVPCENASGNG
ncbi:MAG TPA: Gfo/Idh/MocA family oxidoreductase [Acidimicrobiia bacterium]|jgi:predicted dehydrogenase